MKRIISITLIIAMFVTALPVFASDENIEMVITDTIASEELVVNAEDIPAVSYDAVSSIPVTDAVTYNGVQTTTVGEAISSIPKLRYIQEDTITIPATPIMNDENMAVASRSSSSNSFDASYRIANINGKDALSLQNQIGRTNYIGDNMGDEYIDPMTGNLVVTETDLVLPGVDGFDLRLSRYYSLAQAEVYTKSAGIETTPKQIYVEEGMYVVCEEVTNTETGQTGTYYYPYYEWDEAVLRMSEIEARNLYDDVCLYDASYYMSEEDEIITLDYYYASELNSTSYQQMRNNLGAGWSWSFPSVQVIKDDYESEEMPIALYYHDGKGNVMEVKYDNINGSWFENYVGGDITFEIVYDYYPSICGTTRIDYLVEDSDGTEYYFGMYGELRTMVDIYGNKIQFQYDEADYYGYEDMPRLAVITDSVGRMIEFDYSVDGEYEDITVTVTTPLESEKSLSLNYRKRLVDFTKETQDANGNIIYSEYISTEQFLESFTNAMGEVTAYYPANYNDRRTSTQPLQFTFADKTLDSYYASIIGGYANNLVYLLGNIVRPHSHTYYGYDICERNLGNSGVSQAYRVQERGNYLLAANEDSEIEEGYNYNRVFYEYEGDYTGYPYYSSVDDISEGDYVATTTEARENSEIVRHFYKEDDAVLELKRVEKYDNPVGEDLYIEYEVQEYSYKQPSMTKITYSNNENFEGYTYSSYTFSDFSTYIDKRFGKPITVTEELDYNTVIGADREKHAMLYTYDRKTGFMLSKSKFRTDADQCTERYTYDQNNRISQIQHADGAVTAYSYEYTNGHLTKVTQTTENDAGTTLVEEIYTSATNYTFPSTIRKTVTGGETPITQTSTYTYDMLLGVVKTETDNNGNTTYYEYDNLGRVTRVVYPRYATYSSYGEKNIEILPVKDIIYSSLWRDYDKISEEHELASQAVTTSLTYYDVTDLDAEYPTNSQLEDIDYTHYEEQTEYYIGTGEVIESRVLDKLIAGGNNTVLTTKYFYDTGANTITVIDPQGNETVTQYDGLGREVCTTDLFDNKHILEYNINGDGIGFKAQKYFVPYDNSNAKQNIVDYTYDRLQRVVSEKGYSSYPDSYSEVKYAYDFVGNVTQITDANGSIRRNTYDNLNRLISTKNANNEILENTYDNAGNIKAQTLKNIESVLYQRSYDGEGKIITDTDNAGNSNVYKYNNLGQLVQSWDKDDKYFNASYNEMGILDSTIKTVDEESIIGRKYTLANPYGANIVYELSGNYDADYGVYLAQIKETSSYSYSPTGKLLEQINSYNQSTGVSGVKFKPYMSYDYDTMGNLLLSYVGLYDEANSAIWGFATNYEYDKGRVTKVQLDGKVNRNTANSHNALYEYYPDGKLKSVTYPALADGAILKSEYVYDGLSRITNLTNYKGTEILSSYAYTYDNNGNILTVNETVGEAQYSTSYTYDKLNRIATVAGSKGADSYYEYDARGNRKANFEQIDFLSEENAEFSYNAEDKLTYAEVEEDSTAILYSANGYRFLKQENTTYPEFYIYDNNGRLHGIARPIPLIKEDNTQVTVMYPTTQYIWGPDRVLAKIDVLNDETYYYLYNGHGDVVQNVDTAGNIVNSYDYDVWGNFLTKQETIDNHFTYFGQTYDETTGLYYLRARYYDPSTGRFTQQDPAEDGYNWYVYGNNSPVMFVDESGTDGKTVGLGKGWYYRIDSADSSTKTQRHIHIYNSKKSYAQNEDGSPHDKNNNNSGMPPKSILNKVKEKAKWDYKEKDNKFFSKTDIQYLAEGAAIITYADKHTVIKYFGWYEVQMVTKNSARKYYYDSPSKNNTQPPSTYVPFLPSVTLPAPAYGLVPVF